MDYEEARRGLAEAMGWRDLRDSFGVLRGRLPGRKSEAKVPDPLHSAQDAEALEAWLVGQGWLLRVDHVPGGDTPSPSVDWPVFPARVDVRLKRWNEAKEDWESLLRRGIVEVTATDEPDPVRRRRRALVEAAWQAVLMSRDVPL